MSCWLAKGLLAAIFITMHYSTFFVAAQAFSCSMINVLVIPIWDMMKQNIAILVQDEYSFFWKI